MEKSTESKKNKPKQNIPIRSNHHDQLMFRDYLPDEKNKTTLDISPKDLKFYRKRVFEHVHLVHKYLFTGETMPTNVHPTVVKSYKEFVKTTVDVLKTEDEIEYYHRKNDNEKVSTSSPDNVKDDAVQFTMAEINKHMIKSVDSSTADRKGTVMTNFVKLKPTKPTTATVIPEQMNFDPYDLKLKNKRLI